LGGTVNEGTVSRPRGESQTPVLNEGRLRDSRINQLGKGEDLRTPHLRDRGKNEVENGQRVVHGRERKLEGGRTLLSG